jgi:hypothetical protein
VQQGNELDRWEKTRRMGRTRFILVVAVAWGLPFALLFSFMFSLATRQSMHDDTTFTKMLQFPVTLPISLLGGAAFGVWFWIRSERDYQRRKNTPPSDDQIKNAE